MEAIKVKVIIEERIEQQGNFAEMKEWGCSLLEAKVIIDDFIEANGNFAEFPG